MEPDPAHPDPSDWESLLRLAHDQVSEHFARRVEDARQGFIEVSGERYLMVRAASLSHELFLLIQELLGANEEAEVVALELAYDLAHAIGRSDARWFTARFPEADFWNRFFLGPAHFAHSGWGAVILEEGSRLEPGPGFQLRYHHDHSFEADVWLQRGLSAHRPVCRMNAGYSSGWCSEVFGVTASAVEVSCRALGHDSCRFVMAPAERLRALLETEFLPHAAGDQELPRVPDPFLRQRMERELRRSKEELERRVAERTEDLSRLATRLQNEILEREKAEREAIEAARWEAMVHLSGGIAHDFNNLMQVVLGELDLLEPLVSRGSREAEALGRIREASRAAGDLSLSLINFIHPEKRGRESLDLEPTLREVLALLSRTLPRDIRLEFDIPAPLGSVRGNREQLGQFLTHLLVHARPFVPDKGRVLVRATRSRGERPPEMVRLELTFEGDPNAPTQSASSRGDIRASSLSFTTAQNLLESFGGRMEAVRAAPGVLRLEIHLPVAEPLPQGPVSGPTVALPRGAGERVLVVEDHLALQRLLRQILVQSGYQVFVTASPKEALEHLAETPPDLLLTDVILPEMNGRELAQAALQRHPTLKVLFMSGYPEDQVLLAGMATGEARLLQKPFSQDVLLEQIRRVLKDS